MNAQKGFTLIELVVSAGIIAFVSAIVLFNFPRFNRGVVLNRNTRAVASSLREAQARAVQVWTLPDGTIPDNYGVHFSTISPQNSRFVLFSDGYKNGNSDMTFDHDDEAIELFNMEGNIIIEKFEITEANILCGGVSPSELSILFYRPDPEVVVTCDGGALPDNIPTVQDLPQGPYKIFVKWQGLDLPSKIINVWRTGQITITQE